MFVCPRLRDWFVFQNLQRNLCVSFSWMESRLFVDSNTIFFVQFPVDPFPHRVAFNLIHFLCKCSASASHVINRFFSIITEPTFTILLCLINFCFINLIQQSWRLYHCFILIIEGIQLLFRFLFLNHIQIFSFEISLEIFIRFSSHFCLLLLVVLLIIVLLCFFRDCNYSFFGFLFIQSSSGRIDA